MINARYVGAANSIKRNSNNLGLVIIILSLTIALEGCQTKPEAAAVGSKNRDIFEYSESNTSQNREEKSTEKIHREFSGANGTEYMIDLITPDCESCPLLEITPHSITPQEAKAVAQAFFGDSILYKHSEIKTKEEIENFILELKAKIADRDSMIQEYGDEEYAEDIISLYENMIEEYSKQYENAPEKINQEPCDWSFHPKSYYTDDTMIYNYSDYEAYNKSQYILADGEINGVSYIYNVCNRSEEDYRIHDIWITFNERGLEEYYYFNAPSDSDIESTLDIVENIIGQLPWDGWAVDFYKVDEIQFGENDTRYAVKIVASRSYNGIRTIHQDQLTNLKSEDIFASNYYYETMEFVYGDGHLITFDLESPMDIVRVVSEDVSTMAYPDIIDSLQEYLFVSDSYNMPGNANVTININQADWGFSRIRKQNDQVNFYLIPSFSFSGSLQLQNQRDEILEENNLRLATVNAVDGTIINTELGY